MTALTLSAVFMNLASDPSQFVAFPNTSQLNVSTDQGGQVRVMASGRLRLVRNAGQPRTFTLTFPLSARSAIDWIEQHVGDLVCVRDDRGRKVYGVYLSAPIAESIFSANYGDISLTITEVTYSEAV